MMFLFRKALDLYAHGHIRQKITDTTAQSLALIISK